MREQFPLTREREISLVFRLHPSLLQRPTDGRIRPPREREEWKWEKTIIVADGVTELAKEKTDTSILPHQVLPYSIVWSGLSFLKSILTVIHIYSSIGAEVILSPKKHNIL